MGVIWVMGYEGYLSFFLAANRMSPNLSLLHFLIPLDVSPLKAASVGDVSLSRPLGIVLEPAGDEMELDPNFDGWYD